MIKLGIEATSVCTPHRSGIANYTASLIEALATNNEFQTNFNLDLLYKLSRIKKRTYCFNPQHYKPVWHYNSLLPINKSYRLVHSPDNIFLNFKGAKKIVTIHDLAILKKENDIKGYTDERFKSKVIDYLTFVSKKADAIITVSQFTKNDFLNHFDFPENKVFVTHLGVRLPATIKSTSNILEKNNLLPKKYVLFTGMISIRKNLINLIKAFKESGLYTGYKLVLAGSASMGYDKIITEVKKVELENTIVFTGFISDIELSDLFKNAKAFLFPTFYEGFGMPIIEAMNYQVPVLIGNRGAAPEIAANNAIQANPFDVCSIAEGIKKTIEMNNGAIEAAAKHAATFTWEKCAKETLDTYKRVLTE